ncbi:DUF2247 family protein [Sinomonas mesophila]|uniref:DUF2247 family protein n=1 Tax=Sinomonas mesophila TaxID=1531955 RepID=UPI000985E0D7|nr:DUF2247 family protein [Sinomonas mesophila]
MTEDLVKFRLTAAFVLARLRLLPSELAYGYTHGWFTTGRDPRSFEPPAILLSNDYDRVPDLISEIDETTENADRVWLFLALDWLYEHRDEYSEPLEIVEMIYSDFDYPAEIEGFVRFMPPPPGAATGNTAIERRWREYLRQRSEEYASRP